MGSSSPASQTGQIESGTSENSLSGFSLNNCLKLLKVPLFGGDKTKLKEFWALFKSLFDQLNEVVNLRIEDCVNVYLELHLNR